MTTAARTLRPSINVGSVRLASLLLLGAAVLAAGVATFHAGGAGAAGVVVGAAVVLGFFLFGALCAGVAAAVAPSTALLVALLTYVLQVVLLLVGFLALSRSGATPDRVDPHWLTATVIGGTLLWVVGLLVQAARSSSSGATTGTGAGVPNEQAGP